MKRNVSIAAIAATLVSAAAFAAGPGGYGMGGGHGMGGFGMGGFGMGGGMGGGGMGGYCQEQGLNALELTSEQRSAIASIQSESSGKQFDLMEAMHELRTEAFRNNRSADPATYAAMDQLRQKMLELRQQRIDRIEAVLTPEQRAQWRPGGPRGAPWRG